MVLPDTRFGARALALAAVLSLAAAPLAPGAGTRPVHPSQTGAAAQLLGLEDQWAAGVVKRDRALFERLLAPGFVYTEDDRLITREALIKDISTGADTVTSARNEGMAVHLFGETAVVTGWLTLAGRGPGGAFNRRFRFTDTWVRSRGRWQIVAAQDHLVPAHGK